MTTDKHVDPAAPLPELDAADAAGDAEDAEDVPQGLIRFELEPEAIAEALAAPSLQVRSTCQGLLARSEVGLCTVAGLELLGAPGTGAAAAPRPCTCGQVLQGRVSW